MTRCRACAVIAVLLLGSCGGRAGKGHSFSVRAVASQHATPCSSPPSPISAAGTLPLVQAGQVVGCVVVGPARVSRDDVARATVVKDPLRGDWSVTFVLKAPGASALDALAREQYQKQAAVEVDGQVLNILTISATSFGGRGVVTRLDEATAARVKQALR